MRLPRLTPRFSFACMSLVGRGDFSVSSRHTQGSNFLVVVHQYKSKQVLP